MTAFANLTAERVAEIVKMFRTDDFRLTEAEVDAVVSEALPSVRQVNSARDAVVILKGHIGDVVRNRPQP